MLLDHGRLLALSISEDATYGVQQLRHFMASHHDELCAAHVKCDRACANSAGLKEHMVKYFANMQISKIWGALATEKAHAHWVNVWGVLALLRTYCPPEAVVGRAISLCRRFNSGMQDIVESHVLSMCMALHSHLPPLQQWAKGQGVALAWHLAARARFDLCPRRRVSRQPNATDSMETTML